MQQYFSADDWKTLSSIPEEKAKDATFIRKLIGILYADNPSVLLYRTLYGCKAGTLKSKDGSVHYRSEKYPITPEKRLIIKKAMDYRIRNIRNIPPSERTLRSSERNLNNHICTGIINIQKRIALTDEEITANASEEN